MSWPDFPARAPLFAAAAVAALVDGVVLLDTPAVTGTALAAGATALFLATAVVIRLTVRPESGSAARLIVLPAALPLLAWAAITAASFGVSRSALQNLATLVTFVLAVEAAHLCAQDSEQVRRVLLRLLEIAPVPAAAVLLVQNAGLLPVIVGTRTFALAVLPAFIVLRCASTLRGAPRTLLTLLYTAAVLSSLSRTASALLILVLLVGEAARRGRHRLRLLIAGAVVVGGGYLALTRIPAVQERFFGGDVAYRVGEVTLNTSGRDNLWNAMWQGIRANPLLGHGLGAAHDRITELYVTVGEPHNDYLRLLYDMGVVGLVWWALVVLALVIAIARLDARCQRAAGVPRLVPALALAIMSLAMVTDNVIIYSFVLVPFGILVGAASAPARPESVHEDPRRAQLLHATRALR